MSGTGSYISNPDGPLATLQAVPKPKPEKKAKKAAWQDQKRQIAVKRPDEEEIKKEQEILDYVRKRDGGKCQVCGVTGSQAHHIIPKRSGGRGQLKELIDHKELRVLLCVDCHHDGAHGGHINPYDFYLQAIQEKRTIRILLMKLLVNEWAKYGPMEVIGAIREDNKVLWKQIMGSIPVNPGSIGMFWEEAVRQIKELTEGEVND